MKWITRERPKIDRIACPWLIKNFIDKEAEFIYVPFGQVKTKAKELYKKYGFKVWGNMKNSYKLKDGTYRDEIIMGRMI